MPAPKPDPDLQAHLVRIGLELHRLQETEAQSDLLRADGAACQRSTRGRQGPLTRLLLRHRSRPNAAAADTAASVLPVEPARTEAIAAQEPGPEEGGPEEAPAGAADTATGQPALAVHAAPFGGLTAVREFERELAALPRVREVVLRGFEGSDAAVFDVRLEPGTT